MADDQAREAFGVLLRERPVEPPRGFSDELFRRLARELDLGDEVPPVWLEERSGLHRRRGTIAVAAAIVALVGLILASILVAVRPESALAVVRDAQGKLDGAPPFEATVVYDLNPAGAETGNPSLETGVPQGATATIQMSYGGPSSYRQEIVGEERILPRSGLPTTGSFLVWDGERIGSYDAVRRSFTSIPSPSGFEPLREFSWNAPYPDWESICRRSGSEVLPDERIGGRPARHVRCGDYRGDTWELWTDRETGLILKVVGAVGNDDVHPFPTARDGGFEVTSIRYDPALAPGTFVVEAPPGADDFSGTAQIPAFEATVEVRSNRAGVTDTDTDAVQVFHVAYRDEGAWRRDLLHDDRPGRMGGAGSFWVWDGTQMGEYRAAEDAFSLGPDVRTEVDPRSDLSPSFMRSWGPTPEGDVVPWTRFVREACVETGAERVLDRPALHYVCRTRDATIELWVDAEAGLILRERSPTYVLEVTRIAVDPGFAPDAFTFVPPEGAVSADEADDDPFAHVTLVPGEAAPDWSATLLDGGSIRLEDLRGRPILALFFADWCPPGDPACDVLPQFQLVYDRWKNRVAFVWVDVQGVASEARRILDADGYTFPTTVDQAAVEAWGVDVVPVWVLLDPEGKTREVRLGPRSVAELEDLLGSIP